VNGAKALLRCPSFVQCNVVIGIAVQKPLRLSPLLFIALASAACADTLSDTLNEISRCSGIVDATERLHCYDSAAPRAKEALQPNPQNFGRPAPQSAEIPKITAVVREFSRTARGQAVFALDNGQTWRQLDGDDVRVRDPKPGAVLRVIIERGALGSYNLVIEGRNGMIRVRRIE
jgi:hypothetical protein